MGGGGERILRGAAFSPRVDAAVRRLRKNPARRETAKRDEERRGSKGKKSHQAPSLEARKIARLKRHMLEDEGTECQTGRRWLFGGCQ